MTAKRKGAMMTTNSGTLEQLMALTVEIGVRTASRHFDELRTTADVPMELTGAIGVLVEAMEPERWDGSDAVTTAIECLQLSIEAEEREDPDY